jgi:hypothetical protein
LRRIVSRIRKEPVAPHSAKKLSLTLKTP